jgi:hydrazine synthase alpha subunit-like protein
VKVRMVRFLIVVAVLGGGFSSCANQLPAGTPDNLAYLAKVSASSEYDGNHRASFAVDGKIPAADGKNDFRAVWCVRKATVGDHGKFFFEWAEPVEVVEIVYFARMAMLRTECWKDYEVYLDDAKQPVVKETFEMIPGGQRIRIPKTAVRKITLSFLNSYGGSNPGASEIMVFGRSPTEDQLKKLAFTLTPGALASIRAAEKVDREKLRELIDHQMKVYGPRYAAGKEHLARLAKLEEVAKQASGDSLEEIERQMDSLEREAMLFDVDRLVSIKRYEILATHVYTYHYEGFQAGGGLYVTSVRDPQGDRRELVATPTGQILDCDLSYDGQVVLFSWRRTEDEGYHLWTINVDGTNLTRLTDGPWNDYNACWLPDGGIAFLCTKNPQFAYCWNAPVGIVHRMDADGSNVRKLSANYLNDFTPYVLDDGRIIYSRWEYVDKPAIPIQSLWTINPDGTDLSVYFGNRVLSPGTFMEPRSIPGSTKILCTMTGHNGPTRGAIGIIDRSRGVNAQAAIENITPDVPVPGVDQGSGNFGGSKQYNSPVPLDGRRFMVSCQGPVLVRTLDGGCQAVALPAPDDGMQFFCTQPVRARPRPLVLNSTLSEEAEDYATVYLQDVYNGLEPVVARGDVTRLRVIREMEKTVRLKPQHGPFGWQFPCVSCGATYAGKEILGEVPVDEDGSACFRVPAGVPLYFQVLDSEGRALQRMRSFTHLMPGEVQGCIGCHEHRRQASRPQLGDAYSRAPEQLEPPEWGPGGFDYSRIVQPVLDHYCVECHNPTDAPRATLGMPEPVNVAYSPYHLATGPRIVDLTGSKTDYFSVSYDVLARENQGGRGSPYVNWIPSYNTQEWNVFEIAPKTWGSPQSMLANLVLTGHPDAEGKPRFEMDRISQRRILAWIDLDIPYYGNAETAYPNAQSCRKVYPGKLDTVLADVTARRCVGCHEKNGFPRRPWTRITEPESNNFLMAPLAKSEGGRQSCGEPVFKDKNDPDYRAILATFEPITKQLSHTPRMDMPGGKPSPTLCRTVQ